MLQFQIIPCCWGWGETVSRNRGDQSVYPADGMWVWNPGEMIDGKTEEHRKTCSSANFLTKNSTCTDPGQTWTAIMRGRQQLSQSWHCLDKSLHVRWLKKTTE